MNGPSNANTYDTSGETQARICIAEEEMCASVCVHFDEEKSLIGSSTFPAGAGGDEQSAFCA